MLEIEKLSASYGKKEVLKDISFSVKPHTVTCIIGKNGSGKTTLLSAICCTMKYKGQISFCGKNLAMMSSKERARTVAFLPQQLPSVPLTTEEIVKMGRMPYLDIGQRFTSQDEKAVEDAIKRAEIQNLKDKRADCISGGERQKVYLAMILAQQTRILALDEPATYLDIEHRNEVYGIIKKLKTEEKKTIITVMHDITAAIETADNIVFLDGGRLIFFGSAEECVQSGLIEKIFKVKKYEYMAEDGKRILYK